MYDPTIDPFLDARRPILLDLFCGAGGAAMGYYRAGFRTIVGVDIAPQPRYPFIFVQADALEYARQFGAYFDMIHASPPCQGYSRTAKILEGKGLPNRRGVKLIEPLRECLNGWSYIIENVPGAPLIDPVVLCGTQFGLRVYRHRLFESPMPLNELPHASHTATTGSHRGYSKGTPMITVGGHNYNFAEGAAAMGMTKMGRPPLPGTMLHVVGHSSGVQAGREALDICWMTRDELSQAIPPAYTEYLGRQLLAHLGVA